MRASAASSDRRAPAADPMVSAVTRRLPRPVVWLLWLLAALFGSVLLGFLAGLARPREPDPWAVSGPPASPPPPPPASDLRPSDPSEQGERP